MYLSNFFFNFCTLISFHKIHCIPHQILVHVAEMGVKAVWWHTEFPVVPYNGAVGTLCAAIWCQVQLPISMLPWENTSVIWCLMEHGTIFFSWIHVVSHRKNPLYVSISGCRHMYIE